MDYKELMDRCKELRDAILIENGGNVDQYISHEDSDRHREWYMLKLVLDDVLEKNAYF